MISERELEQETESYLNQNFEGDYHCSADLDMSREEAIVTVTAEDYSDTPKLGRVVDRVIDETDIEEPDIKIDYRAGEGEYDVLISEP